jgi:uncharacterized protein (TIGR03118 family)
MLKSFNNFIECLEERRLMSTSSFYVQTNLVSDNAVAGTRVDSNLINGWGLAASPTGPWWVSAAETGLSIAYDGNGAAAAPNVEIPPAAGETESNPTGAVANNSKGFVVTSGGKSAPSEYVFVTENGTISGWNHGVDETHAILAVDNSAAGAIYKGATIGMRKGGNFLFAADFHNGKVAVFTSKFKPVTLKHGAFRDTKLPAGYAPFNIANVGGLLYVSYALQDADAEDDVSGAGHGFIDIYRTNGSLVKRFASGGVLDSPWGMVVTPHNFGKLSDDVLIGNFGDGKISAFNRKGKFRGFLVGANGNAVVIPGLWGLAFGNGAVAGPANSLFFAAGPQDESHGLFGRLTAGKSHHHVASTGGGGLGY